MNSLQTNYQALVSEENEVPHESVIFHVASEGSKSRWNHVGDLDSLFKRIYTLHQKHGYWCILLDQILCVVFFIMICFGSIYAMDCIYFNFDYPSSPLANKTDIHLCDLFMDIPSCMGNFGVWAWTFMVIGILFVMYKCYKLWHIICSYDEIRSFYNTALKIDEKQIGNITWHEVQCRLREVQHEQQLCVHKSDITELDIYHRILRHKNYMVALVNKNILPLKYNILGSEWIYLSSGLEYNIELLLFGSFSSPFKETGTLKEDYKKYSKRKECADELSRKILIVGIVNLMCSPFLSVYQLALTIVKHSGFIKHAPSILSTRRWSRYSRLYLRHFNELDHELEARLNRAYKPAQEYMKSFSTPMLVILCKFFVSITGCAAVFFIVWGIFKEKLIMVDNVFVLISVFTFAFWVSYACIPDEFTVYFPNSLMSRIVAEVHYVPDHFKEKAHTTAVKDEFANLYCYTSTEILEELMSPIITPIVLICYLRYKALDIVDFFRNFTVEVAGVGDVCSFALMDISRHGNHNWLGEGFSNASPHEQAEDGKTELSLIHFTLMNPHWQPPPSSDMFINEFRGRVNAVRDFADYRVDQPFYTSLRSLSTLGSKYTSLARSIHESLLQPLPGTSQHYVDTSSKSERVNIRGGMSSVEGPPYLVQGVLTSLHGDLEEQQLLQGENVNPLVLRNADMSFSALYMHEAHQRILELPPTPSGHLSLPAPPEPENNGNEESPLLVTTYGK